MSIRFAHTNIISKDWKRLANFYVEVFGCKQNHTTHLSGEYLEKGTGVQNATLEGTTLQLPGYETNPPTIEIFQYSTMLEKAIPVAANRVGYGHIAFQVDNIEEILQRALEHGAEKVGEVISKDYPRGTSSYIYIFDPENNIVELQHWLPK